MKLSEKLQESQAIGRCTSLLETMNTRLATGGRNWQGKQSADWETLRMICTRQIVARTEATQVAPSERQTSITSASE